MAAPSQDEQHAIDRHNGDRNRAIASINFMQKIAWH
jgi:hypothetical protein